MAMFKIEAFGLNSNDLPLACVKTLGSTNCGKVC